MNIKSENQANIMIVNALNNLDFLIDQFRFTTDARRADIIRAIKIYSDELESATNYKTEVNG